MRAHREVSRTPTTGPSHWIVSTVFASIAASCSSGAAPAPQSNSYPPTVLNQLASEPPRDQTASSGGSSTAPASPTPPPAPDREPELVRRDVPESVIAGRDVSFGIDVVDEEMDPVRIELGDHPEGVEFDPRTLTVRWHVPRGATGAQHFVARITEHPGQPNARIVERAFDIQAAARAPVPGAPTIVPPLVGTLVTITSPDYLARAARDWPIERLLETLRDTAIDALPQAEQAGVQRPTGAAIFRELLTQYAQFHQNPRLDPSSPQFDRHFESAHWRLVAVRPRVNKSIEELRLAYQAVDVAEPVWMMFRVRLFRGATPPNPEVARANNVAFTRLVHDAFFNGDQPKPGIAEGRAPAVSSAVANLVRSVLTFRDPQNAALRTGLVAIPEEARMGGGSVFDAQGAYQHGNAWAFTVAGLRVEPAQGATRAVHAFTTPISSFTFDIGENADHSAFVSVCPPRYREGGAGNEPGLAALCAPDGTVRIRERDAQNHWVATKRDSLNEHIDVTAHEMVASVPLRDPRRRNFEENGMTCVQCHMRNFDDGVLSEQQVSDPRVHQPITPARDVARVTQQILPVGVVHRSPWLVQQETFQLCDLGRKMNAQLGTHVTLACPEGY
jgi:hypothetical protein